MTLGNIISLIKLAIPIGLLLAVLFYRHDARSAHLAFDRLKAEYIADSQLAAAMEQARVARVTTEQQRITADVSTDYDARIADLRARYDRMRAQAGRSPGGQPVPGISVAASDPVAATDDQGLSLDRRYTASQQAEQLDALISWAERQHAVDPNAP